MDKKKYLDLLHHKRQRCVIEKDYNNFIPIQLWEYDGGIYIGDLFQLIKDYDVDEKEMRTIDIEHIDEYENDYVYCCNLEDLKNVFKKLFEINSVLGIDPKNECIHYEISFYNGRDAEVGLSVNNLLEMLYLLDIDLYTNFKENKIIKTDSMEIISKYF